MDDFLGFARAHGILIDPGKFYPSSRIQRCPTADKPRSDNGAWFWDGERGWVMDWAGDARPTWYGKKREWTPADKSAWIRQRDEEARRLEKQYADARVRAHTKLQNCELKEHGYLQLKGFPEETGLVDQDHLFIPMRDVSNNDLIGYQEIHLTGAKWEKKMLWGMRAKGAVFRMGQTSPVWLVEGYATGLSVRAALRAAGLPGSVTVCFSANNLVYVADKIPGERYVFADNDQSKTGQEAAKATGLPWTMADEEGWDANDLHKNRGLFAVLQKVMTCTKT